jgi:hypothetical protein
MRGRDGYACRDRPFNRFLKGLCEIFHSNNIIQKVSRAAIFNWASRIDNLKETERFLMPSNRQNPGMATL